MPRFAKFLIAIAITLSINALVWFLSFNFVGVVFSRELPKVASTIFSIMLFGIGLGQWLYVIPVCIYLAIKRRFTWLQGVIVGAILTVLLNGGCWVIFSL